jgi:hypothetical protein
MRRRWLTLLLSPLGLVLISAGRLLIISNYNTTTATTIASSGGYINTLLGSIIPLVPVFIPYVALLLLLFRQFTLSALTFAFAAFIAPTSLTLPISRSLAAEDTYVLLARIDANRPTTLAIALLIVIIAYLYFRSFVEALATLLMLTVAVALLSAPIIKDLYLPSSLQSANSRERSIGPLFRQHANTALPSTERHVIIAIIFVLVVILIVTNLAAITFGWLWLAEPATAVIAVVARAIPDIATLVIALVTTIAFFPYIYNIYPVPHHTEYYVGILRSPWLPAEKLSLRSGRNYYGYALSADHDWFTVLLSKTRKIVYIHTDDIVRRSVCETLSQRKIPLERPLITTFYRKPATIRPCADRKHLVGGSGSATRTRPPGQVPRVPRGHTLPGGPLLG